MNFKEYINELSELDNQEIKTELQTYYTKNAATISYFKVIDTTIQNLLNQPRVSAEVVKQLRDVLPTLVKLKSIIISLPQKTYADGFKSRIEMAVKNIQEQMGLGEVDVMAKDFFELLDGNRKAYESETTKTIVTEPPKSTTPTLHELEEAILCGWKIGYKERVKVAQESRRNNVLMRCAVDSAFTVRNAVGHNPYASDEVKRLAKETSEKMTKKPTDDGWCFVATACYGDYDAPEVVILRKYRDENLLTNWLGTLFVKFYYAISPPLARQIAKSDTVRSFLRKHFLGPIVKCLEKDFEAEE